MTLKEKFNVISCKDCDMPYCDSKCTMLSDRELNKLEKIADEFAIDFAEWCLVNNVYKSKTFEDDNLFLCGLQKYDDETDKIYYLYELLEIYKKEKGL